MPEITKRLAGLPSEKRQLLEKLLGRNEVACTTASAEAADPAPAAKASFPKVRDVKIPQRAGSPGLTLTMGSSADEVKEGFRRFYDGVSTQLDSSVFGDFSFFLNYGYVPDLSRRFSRVELPEHFINKNSVRLVLEVIGDADVNGCRVLDVGCGRGGTVYVLNQFFQPASIIGLDLAPAAIAFCRRVHKYPLVLFEEGDAEQLPFEDGSFDVVTNIESSHSYPNIKKFHSEVFRVLAPGGRFLYTDVHPVVQWEEYVPFLQHLGFRLERDTDITVNVLLSCDEVAKSRVGAFDRGNDPALMRNFLATPDSEVYVEMSRRRWKYSILRLSKPSYDGQ